MTVKVVMNKFKYRQTEYWWNVEVMKQNVIKGSSIHENYFENWEEQYDEIRKANKKNNNDDDDAVLVSLPMSVKDLHHKD